MNEHSFIKAIHKKLTPEVYRWKIHDTYTGGVPDAFYAGPANILFVEYKYIKQLPVKDSTPVKTSLTKLQAAWLETMQKNGVSVALIIGSPNNICIKTSDFFSPISKIDFRNKNNNYVTTFIEECVLKSRMNNEHPTSTSSQLEKNLES